MNTRINSATAAGASRPWSRTRTVLAACLLTLLSAQVQASVQIPPVPLQSGSSVPPNLMFIIDDSGSMQFEIMPDDYVFWGVNNGSAVYVFPRANNVYASGTNPASDYTNRVATVADGVAYNALARSPQVNTNYYNPSVTYTPWVRANGTLYPNASTTCAPHNPEPHANYGVRTGRDLCIDLTQVQTNFNSNAWVTCVEAGTCTLTTDALEYWPATYFWKSSDATSKWAWASYQKVEIRSGNTYTGHGRENRTDCAAGSCTYAQEIQNFANWYTYYRSRIFASRAGIGRAFSQLNVPLDAAAAPRVGFASINAGSRTVDNVTSPGTIITGVRPFTGVNRTNWFTQLYSQAIPAQGTPLRRALDDAGQYFSRADEQGPWSTTVGAAGGEVLACRQTFSILMTDGYWTHDDASRARTADARADVDSTNGPTITGPDDRSYTYTARSPFNDNRGNTLADVAMHYWKRDLLPGVPNRVPTSPQNPAFWQHMVTFGVGLGVTGSIDPDDAFAAIGSGDAITWPDPVGTAASFNAPKLDDLLHAAVNSRGGFFSAADPVTFAEELSKTLATISERTASGSNVAANSVALRDETRIFQASYVGGQWTGELASYPISASGVALNPVWRATDPGNIPAHGSRKVFTSLGANKGTFQALRATALDQGNTHSVSNYLMGDASNELRNQGTFRNRNARLGDIVHSSPAFVGQSTPTAIYVGANDGMMHAFNAETGEELFAYVPGGLSNDRLKALSDPNYTHQYYVDGPIAASTRTVTPGKNIIVGTLGRGGRGVYALDVTNPATFGATQILWDTANTTLADWAAADRNSLGLVVNQPLIARTNATTGSGNNVTNLGAVAIFGNGLPTADSSGRAALMIVHAETGRLIRRIPVGPEGDTGNGLLAVRGWDHDGDGLTDHVYAADLKGNIWKFDLNFIDTANWGLADGTCIRQCNNNNRLAREAGGDPLIATGKPITGGLQIAFHPTEYKPWVMFGTGKYLEQSDINSVSQQRWYGVADTGARVTNHSQLTKRNIIVSNANIEGTPVRAFEQHAPLPADSRGWYIDLWGPESVPPYANPSERMVADPLMVGRVLVAASILPSSDPCDSGGTGYLNAVDGFTGTSVQRPFFDVDGDGSFDDDVITLPDGSTLPVGSVNLGVAMPTSPTVVENLLVVGGSLGTTGSVGINNPLIAGRISWREIIGD